MAKEEFNDAQASFDSNELEELTERVRRTLDIRDRQYGIPSKTYPKCFVGSEAVARMVEEGIAGDADDAVRIGNMMLAAGVFHQDTGQERHGPDPGGDDRRQPCR